MSIVAGADFGTLSVRISIFDRQRGKLGSALAEYPLHSSPTDSFQDHSRFDTGGRGYPLGR